MKTDVQLLIVALKAERDSLTRAIGALEAIGGSQPTAPVVARKPAARHRDHIDGAVKRTIVSEMLRVPNGDQAHAAARLSREHGVKKGSILTGWRRWEKSFHPWDATVVPATAPVLSAQEMQIA